MSMPLLFLTLALKKDANCDRVKGFPVVGDRKRAPLEASLGVASWHTHGTSEVEDMWSYHDT
jgi:hypothetical protein